MKQPKIKPYAYDVLTSSLSWDEHPKEEKASKQKTSKKTPKASEVTPEQRKAVERAQNAHRGRGHKKRNRVSVHFAASQNVVEAIDELHYRLGRTKNELYNEALELLVSKYVNS